MGQLGVFKNWEVHDTFRKLGVEFNSPLLWILKKKNCSNYYFFFNVDTLIPTS